MKCRFTPGVISYKLVCCTCLTVYIHECISCDSRCTVPLYHMCGTQLARCWCWQSAVGSVGRGSWQLAVAVLAVLACVQYLPAVIHGFRSFRSLWLCSRHVYMYLRWPCPGPALSVHPREFPSKKPFVPRKLIQGPVVLPKIGKTST